MSLFHATVFIIAIIAMLVINPMLTALLVVIIPFIGILSLKLSRSVKPTFVNIRTQFSRLNTVVQENISGNRVVKAFAREPYEIEKVSKRKCSFYGTKFRISQSVGDVSSGAGCLCNFV